MKTMAVSEFEADFLAALEGVRKTGEPLLVTRHAKPVAQIVAPPEPEADARNSFGCMAGTAREIGDILEPLPESDWDVLS